MKLSKLYQETLSENNIWNKLNYILKEYSQINEEMSARLSLFLNEANKVIFDKFNINPKDEKYFIAGSARLYLYPELVYEINKLDPSFPTTVGDLDIIIPNEELWTNAGLGDYLKIGIYRPYQLNPPLTELNIEAFTVWDPKRAGGAYANVNIRPESEIISSVTFEDGYWFMAMEDVLDYKKQMGRDKEVAIVNLIKQYEDAGSSPESNRNFLKKIALAITKDYSIKKI
jgi:hypothetical protein